MVSKGQLEIENMELREQLLDQTKKTVDQVKKTEKLQSEFDQHKINEKMESHRKLRSLIHVGMQTDPPEMHEEEDDQNMLDVDKGWEGIHWPTSILRIVAGYSFEMAHNLGFHKMAYQMRKDFPPLELTIGSLTMTIDICKGGQWCLHIKDNSIHFANLGMLTSFLMKEITKDKHTTSSIKIGVDHLLCPH